MILGASINLFGELGLGEGPDNFLTWVFSFLAVCFVIYWAGVIFYGIYYLVGLPLRRQERTRLFLDLIETAVVSGQNIEATLVAANQRGKCALGRRFDKLANLLARGLRLGAALEQVPGLLPPRIEQTLKAGEAMGDYRKVLPSCRALLTDGTSITRGALNYVVILAFVMTPLVPLVFGYFVVCIAPKFFLIMLDMGVHAPAYSLFVFRYGWWVISPVMVLALACYYFAFLYVGGPRVSAWIGGKFGGWSDRVLLWLPWRRRRLHRDFATLLAVLLDAGATEAEAVRIAAESTANHCLRERAGRVIEALRQGVKLPEAVRPLDDAGEFRWRLTNACHAHGGFVDALRGWRLALDARAFQDEQAAAHLVTTALVLFNGVVVGGLAASVFLCLISIIDAGVLW